MDGSRLKGIETVLWALRGKIIKHPAFVKGAGAMPDDVEFDRNREEIDRLRDRLAIAMRELKSATHFLDMKERVAFKLPAERRWSANQSIRDQRNELRRVYQLAIDILGELDQLEDMNSRPSIGEIIGAIVEKFNDAGEELVTELRQNHGHYDNLWLKNATVQNVPTGFVLAVLIGYLCIKSRRKRR